MLTGAGTDFCAGADIGEMGMGGLNGSFLRARHMHKVIRALARVQKPVICATRGVAVGMGFSMALAADVIVASETSALLADPEQDRAAARCRRRLVPGAPARRGQRQGPRLLGTHGRPADEALALGLVHKVVPDAR